MEASAALRNIGQLNAPRLQQTFALVGVKCEPNEHCHSNAGFHGNDGVQGVEDLRINQAYVTKVIKYSRVLVMVSDEDELNMVIDKAWAKVE